MGVHTSMAATTTLGRPADRTNLIVRALRERIVTGQLAPGSQLPTRAEIEADFGAGATTVQRALEHLRRDGFIEVNGRQGTFVVDNPPHLTNYALVFPTNPSRGYRWSRFWTALNNEALALADNKEYKLHVFYNIDKECDGDSEEFQRLQREVRAHRLAGLIFAANPYVVEETPILDEAGIRRVAIMGSAGKFGCQSVNPDMESFWSRAAQYLSGRGRRKVAVLLPCGLASDEGKVVEYFRAAGLQVEPFWVQGLNPGAPQFARHSVHLLMSGPVETRPDALIIGDDNYVEYATAGFIAAGVSVPGDVDVVAHCNFPYTPPAALPVTFLGFDARRVLRACIDSIRSSDGAPGPDTKVPAQFENEIDAVRVPDHPARF